MKKVWLIHNNIPPYRVPLFAEIVKHADFDFTVVLTASKCRHRPHWKANADSMPFKVLIMKGMNLGLSDAKSLSISLELLPSLIRNRPDIVICSGFGLSTLIVFVYSRVFGRPYIVWSESTQVTEGLRKIGCLRRWIRRLLARHAGAFIDAGSLSQEYIRSLLQASSQALSFRAYNCVDGKLFSSSNNGDSIEPNQLRRILFVGRLNQNKGIPMLLDVYRSLLGNSKNPIELVLAGDGPLRSMVEEFRRRHESANIEVLGQIPYEQVADYYRKSDVFVLLSLSDCNPLVILEALHSGVPIVCTNRAGNALDFIVPGENGYIVAPTDRETIVTKIRDVLSWSTEKRVLAARTSRRLVKAANYSTSAQAFLDACHELIKNLVQNRS